MADIVERIVVKVDWESNLKDGVAQVEQLGKVAKEDIAHFKNLSSEINAGINDALKESGVTMKQFTEAASQGTKKASESTKTLRQEVREATIAAEQMAKKFGDLSPQAIAAQKNVAKLKDTMSDLKARVDALNPDAKFRSLTQVTQGSIGAVQGLTGALQLFGGENKQIEEIAKKMQGLLNLSMGINSVLELKDAFGNLRAALGLTTAAQEGLKTATAGTAIAMEGAAIGTTSFDAALAVLMVDILPVVAVFAALAAAGYVLTQSLYDDAEALKVQNEQLKESRRLADEAADSYLDFTGGIEHQLEVMKLKGATEMELLKFQENALTQDKELLEVALQRANSAAEYDKINKRLIATRDALEIVELKITNTLKDQKPVLEDIQKIASKQRENVYLTPEQETQLKAFELLLHDNKQAIGDLKEQYDKLNNDLANTQPIKGPELKAGLPTPTNEDLTKWSDYADAAVKAMSLIMAAQNEIAVSNKINTENEIKDQDERFKRGEISQKQYDAKIRQLKRKAAEDDKKLALFNALIQASQAIVNALTQPHPITAVAFAAALSAIQISAIASRPLPKFAKGTTFLGGNQDEIPIIAHRGEAIIPAHLNKEYHPVISAIYKKQIKSSEINSFVENRRKGNSVNTGGNIMDSMELIRAFKSNREVGIRNTKELARLIGEEIVRNYDPRRS